MGQEEALTLSHKEWQRVETVTRIQQGQLTQAAAAADLGLSVRQVKRLCRRLREEGKAGMASKQRGRPSKRRLAPATTQQALALLQARYPDFGPTLAHEKLTEVHGLARSVESVRQVMITAKLHRPKRRAERVLHQTRERRANFGELVQVDGSPHDWFEGRAPRCRLLLFVDDATGHFQCGQFVQAETTLGYRKAIGDYSLAYGKPQAFYSDRHSIFHPNSKQMATAEGLTQLGRALDELQIQLICAHSPQAKGRVERAFATLQDRLVKELRLAGINNWAAANAFLPGFLQQHNARFGVVPRHQHDLHRPVSTAREQQCLKSILTVQAQRKLSQQLACSFENTLYQLEASPYSRRLRGVKVEIQVHPAGQVTISHQGRDLPYTTLRPPARQGRVAAAQTLDVVLQAAAATPVAQTSSPAQARPPAAPRSAALAANHPWRKRVSSAFKRHPTPAPP